VSEVRVLPGARPAVFAARKSSNHGQFVTPSNESISPSERVFIGLGANLGDREAGIRRAIALVAADDNVQLCAVSRIYESEAMTRPGDDPQPSYYNAVAEISTSLRPTELLELLLDVETTLERVRKPETRWEPRTIDLDILLIGDRVIDTDALTVPHPGIAKRAFVLLPLAELAAHQVVPSEHGLTVQDILKQYDGPQAHPLITSHSNQIDHGE
jgi:2-amino-4-hydroxy-6-hydroxymethyldihydropteridine diphosphokinase